MAPANNMLSILIINLFSFASTLPLTEFFPYGDVHGDVILIDQQQNYRAIALDDGIIKITTPHIPFFNRMNNTVMQISTNGYIIFGDEIFNAFTSNNFPFIRDGVIKTAMIAPYWNDLKFTKVTSKLYYNIHTSGEALRYASEELLRRKGLMFQPDFVFVVTWFKVNMFGESGLSATLTFQLVLACDEQATFAFFLYNELINVIGITSIGWQEGVTNTTNYHRHPFQRSLKQVEMVNGSNVNNGGEWIYFVGAGDYAVYTTPVPTTTTTPTSTMTTLMMTTQRSPILIQRFQSCDVRTEPCTSVVVLVEESDAMTNVRCRIQDTSTFQTVISPGFVIMNSSAVQCMLPYSPVIINGNSTGRLSAGFDIQISVDGSSFSETKTTLLLYDSKCISCDVITGNCSSKPHTCQVDGYCLVNGESTCRTDGCVVASQGSFPPLPPGTLPSNVECPNCLCNGKINGNYRYPGNPHYFLQCSNSFAYCAICWPLTLYFVESCNQCLNGPSDDCYISPSSIRSAVRTQTIELSDCPSTCPQNVVGNYAHPTNNQLFLTCLYGTVIGCMSCPDTLYYDVSIGVCNYRNDIQ